MRWSQVVVVRCRDDEHVNVRIRFEHQVPILVDARGVELFVADGLPLRHVGLTHCDNIRDVAQASKIREPAIAHANDPNRDIHETPSGSR